MAESIRILPAIARALDDGKPVVALESSVLAQGLPIPQNRDAAERMVGAVEREEAVAGITAVVRGVPTVGLEPDELERFLRRDGVRKVSARDLPFAMATSADASDRVLITPYRDGPLLVRGPFALADQDGNELAVDRPVVPLCRCGRSRMRPFCDGTHQLVRFRAPSGVERGREPGEPAAP